MTVNVELDNMTIFDLIPDVEPVALQITEPVVNVDLSEDAVDAKFDELRYFLKDMGNPYFYPFVFEMDMFKDYIPVFLERGWIIKTSSDTKVLPQLLFYSSVDEIFGRIKTYIDGLKCRINEGDGLTINWWTDTWRKWADFYPKNFAPTVEEHLEKMRQLHVMVEPLQAEIAIMLGWEHYKNSEGSRGSIYEKFTQKQYKKHFLPFFKKNVVAINNYEDMKVFVSRKFLMGRWDDWSTKGCKPLPPRPNVESLSLSPLQIACLVEANKTNVDEIVTLVLKHSGGGGGSSYDRSEICVTPTFTWEDYDKSLSDTDIDILITDAIRMKNMHKKQ